MFKSRTALSRRLVVLLCLCSFAFGGQQPAAVQPPQESVSPISITFMDIEAGKVAIIDDSLDPYFDRMQPMEMSAKTGSPITGQTLAEQRAQCRQRYQAGVQEFTDAEKEVIRQSAEKLYSALKPQYPLFAEMPWSFIKVSNSVEGGLPHTRDKHIVLSEGACKGFGMVQRIDPQRAALSIAGLLVHEQMHVFQRLHPGLFDSLYTEIWGFIKAKEIASCPWLEKHHLINPDATDCRWVFPIRQGGQTSYILPLVVFAEGEGLKRMGRDFRMIAVELVGGDGRFRPKLAEDGRPVYRNLLAVPEYREVLAPTRNIYHPNEACASLFANIVMFELASPGANQPQAGAEQHDPLREWFSENLKRPAAEL